MATSTGWMTTKRAFVLVGVGVCVLLVAAAVWVTARGLMARSELEKAAPLASEVQKAIVAGEPAQAKAASEQLSVHANKAAALTSDPVWDVAEDLPWIGPNLSAVARSAAVTDKVATRVVAPLTGVTSRLNLSTFEPVNGVVDLDSILTAEPVLVKAQQAIDSAHIEVAEISTSETLPQVRSAVKTLSAAVSNASHVLNIVGNAARLAPKMLGSAGPRNYLLVIQNPAEIRATGGLFGAMALIHTDAGHISLVAQGSTAEFREFDTPIQTLPTETVGLYGQLPAQHIQEANLVPQFPLAAQLAAKMWTTRFGSSVDGVIAVDPTVLGYLLKATGPIPLPHQVTLTSANAVQVLLSEVYSIYPDNASQDAFFAQAAASIFQRVSTGNLDTKALLSALTQAGAERRILIWSAHPREQAVLQPTTLAGELPVSTPFKAGFGVYLNDTTGAKMDYYLKVTSSVASRICRSDDHPNARVTVTLTNTAPADAATSLPAYVTGAASFGVPPGSARTKVFVYGPQGSLLVATTSNGAEVAHHAATDQGRAVSQFEVELAPGATTTVSVDFLDLRQFSTSGFLQLTPGVDTRVVSAIAPPCN